MSQNYCIVPNLIPDEWILGPEDKYVKVLRVKITIISRLNRGLEKNVRPRNGFSSKLELMFAYLSTAKMRQSNNYECEDHSTGTLTSLKG